MSQGDYVFDGLWFVGKVGADEIAEFLLHEAIGEDDCVLFDFLVLLQAADEELFCWGLSLLGD